MKKSLYFLALIGILFSACKENMPVIPPPPIIDSGRVVLVEEFTGVRCVACPAGSVELENLLSIYGKNLVVVSIHAGDFSPPYTNQSLYDFRTEEGDQLISFLGNPLFYPAAVINRKDFNGNPANLQNTLATWSGYVESELGIDQKIDVNITKEYDTATRDLKVSVSGFANEDISGDLRVSIYLTESNIQDHQLTPSGQIPDYTHKHVFRTTLTKFDGDSFASQINAGDNYEVIYNTILSEDWNAEECDVVAFISLVAGDSKEVLQAAEAHIID